MNSYSIAATALALMLGATAAAAESSWTGFYAGLSIGTGQTNDTWTNTGNPDFNDVGKTGQVGVNGGYNWQFHNMILGIEADHVFGSFKGSVSCPDGVQSCGHELKDLGSVRGRIGWLGTPSAMIYLTGGWGWGSAKWTEMDPTTGSLDAGGTASHTVSGVVLGAGLEYMFVPNWTLKGEYLHYDLGTFTPADATSFGGMPPTFKLYADTYKLGLNFKY